MELVWRNETGGSTYRIGDRFVKWNPRRTGIDLERERARLGWLASRHRAPTVVSWGQDSEAQWLVTEAMPGECAISERWRAQPHAAIAAIAAGLRALHAVAITDFPSAWSDTSWVVRTPPSLGERPPIDDPVLVHGDACAPNTIVSPSGRWCGHVDFGALAAGDRWADLAVASMSLDWNYGAGYQTEFFDAYGIEPDAQRIAYYRGLWHLES